MQILITNLSFLENQAKKTATRLIRVFVLTFTLYNPPPGS